MNSLATNDRPAGEYQSPLCAGSKLKLCVYLRTTPIAALE
jgi:hypothetical protein